MKDLTILLVDDEEEFISTLAERLGLRGIRALTAFDGESALEMVRLHRPDVVVLDLMMPGIGGIEADKIQALGPRSHPLDRTWRHQGRDRRHALRCLRLPDEAPEYRGSDRKDSQGRRGRYVRTGGAPTSLTG